MRLSVVTSLHFGKAVQGRKKSCREARGLLIALILLFSGCGIPRAVLALPIVSLPANANIGELVKRANDLAQAGNARDAIGIWEQLIKWGEMNQGKDSPELSTALVSLASLYNSIGSHVRASKLLERAVALDEKANDAHSQDLAGSLNDLAMTYLDMGRAEEADKLMKRALGIYRLILPSGHPYLAIAFNNIGQISKERGNYGSAIDGFLHSISINKSQQQRGKQEELSLATTLVNLAQAYLIQGRIPEATSQLLKALDIYKNVGYSGRPQESDALNILGDAYRLQGRYQDAEEVLRAALAIREKWHGKNNPQTANVAANLAIVLKATGRLDEAEALYLRSLEIEKGGGSPLMFTYRGNLAELYLSRKATGKAISLLLPRVSCRSGNDMMYPRELIRTLFTLGKAYVDIGSTSESLLCLGKSLRVIQEVFGKLHPWYFANLRMAALVHARMGDGAQALTMLQEAFSIEQQWLIAQLILTPDYARYSQTAFFGDAYSWPFAILLKDQRALPLALMTSLNRRGVIEQIDRLQAEISGLRGGESRIEKLALLTSQISSISASSQQRVLLQKEREQLQLDLYQQLPISRISPVSTSTVIGSLPENGLLIEFQKYWNFLDADADSTPPKSKYRYLALILKSDGSTQSVQLGPAAPIDAAVRQALGATAEKQTDANALWAQVSEMVIKPLLPHLKGSYQLFITPDGELNRVPFAALPMPQQPDVPLAEAVQLRQLTTGRDLLRLQQPAPKGMVPVVFANPSYDRSGQAARRPAAAGEEPIAQQRSSDLGSKAWAPLPATAQEGQRVAQQLSGRLFTGPEASTTRLEQLQNPRILHIATHGFFVADAEAKPDDPLRVIQDDSMQLKGLRQKDPQLRSGLVLAGANQPDANPNDDGYLTAAEAVTLNLKGTELVVLSACSTGQGDIRTGEGVYGLQRSLAVAGARSTLLSLWKVDDAATLEFMTRFYKRLKSGEGRSDALANTQKEFRAGIPGKPEWKEPYYWAAWQLVGDWRPIPGL